MFKRIDPRFFVVVFYFSYMKKRDCICLIHQAFHIDNAEGLW